MKRLAWLLFAIGLFSPLWASVMPDTIVAFPGAEGFGKYCSGGRGGEVVYVTSLANDGEGSLRWAVQQHPDTPITVVFAVSGEIRLESDLRIKRKNYTIAGQTAPGMGIVITHNKVNFGGSENFIVRNLRFRIGNKNTKGQIITQNAVGAENCLSYIFDHCDFGWSAEENMNSYDSHFITIQYCIVHEGLNDSGHPKGARGYGCQWGGSPATFHHNLLANNMKRSCRFNGGGENDLVVYEDYINNVCYNYGAGSNGCYGGENTAKIDSFNGLNAAHEVNFIANYYRPGPNTTNPTRYFFMASYQRSGTTSWGPSKWYVSGNIYDKYPAFTNNNWSAVHAETYPLDSIRVDTIIRPRLNYYKWVKADSVVGRYDFDQYAYAAESFDDATTALQHVLDTAGAWPRDHVELRLIQEATQATSTYTGYKSKRPGILDVPDDAEGFYDYPVAVAETDTDLDGMPDWWELQNQCDPAVADQNRRDSITGYTMLELYLDYAMRHRPSMSDGYQDTRAFEQTEADESSDQGYTILGQPVSQDTRGIVVHKGHKRLVR